MGVFDGGFGGGAFGGGGFQFIGNDSFIVDRTNFLLGFQWKKLYLSEYTDKLAEEFGLATETYEQQTLNNDTDYVLETDVDFDMAINEDVVVGGECVFKSKVYLDSSVNDCFAKVNLNVKRVRDAVELSLGNGDGASKFLTDGSAGTSTEIHNFTLPETNFSRGDILRLTLTGLGYEVGGATALIRTFWSGTNVFAYIPVVPGIEE